MSSGRPLTFDPARVVDAAMQLFWVHGYEATSLQQLVEATGLSRSSFYQRFGSKHGLFVQCLELYEEQTAALLSDRLGEAESAKDFVAETLAWATEEAVGPTEPRGCLVMNTASEFAQRDPEIATAVNKGLSEYHQVFEIAVRRGQEEGSIEADREPAALASYLVTTMSGLRTMVKAGTAPSTLGETVRLAMTTITT